MKTNKTMLCVLGSILLCAAAAASAADAPKLTFKFNTTNVPGAVQTYLNNMNNEDVMVGQYEESSGVYHGYMWKKGEKKPTNLDDPKGTVTSAYNINFNGPMKVVGVYISKATHQHMGFLYDAKTKHFKDIRGPKGATASAAEAINDKGWIVGWYEDASGSYHGFLLRGNTYKTLDVPGAIGTYANGINNKGYIVFGSWTSSTRAGALTKDFGKTYEKIEVPRTGPLGSDANGINNEDDVTLVWYDSTGLDRGVLCTKCASKKKRKFYKFEFEYPKAYQTYATGINDKHTLASFYQAEEGDLWSGYIATFK